MNLRPPHSLEAHVDGHLAFNQGVAGSRPAGGTDALSLYVYKWEGQKHTFYLDDVMVASLFYMQQVGVRFSLEVQLLGTESRSDTAANL